MKRRRGFSIALVLMVAAVMVTVGAAMAALSSMSLNLAAQVLSRARGEALARGVAAQISYELDQRIWEDERWAEFNYPDMAFGEDAVRERFVRIPLFPDGGQRVMAGGMAAWVTFDDPRWSSLDNLGIEVARRGARGGDVPPYCLELIVNTGLGTGPSDATDRRHFQALISRAWPYAAYCLDAPLQVTSGSRVRGDLYDFKGEVSLGAEPSSVPVDPNWYPYGEYKPQDGFAGSQTRVPPRPPAPVAVGGPVQVHGNVCVPGGAQKVVVLPDSVVVGRIVEGVKPALGADGRDPRALLNTRAPADVRKLQDVFKSRTPTFAMGPMVGAAGYVPLYESDPAKVVYADDLAEFLRQKYPGMVEGATPPVPVRAGLPSSGFGTTVMLQPPLKNIVLWRGVPTEIMKSLRDYGDNAKFRLASEESAKGSFGSVHNFSGGFFVGGGVMGMGGVSGMSSRATFATAAPPELERMRVLVENLNLSDGLFVTGPLTNHFAVVKDGKVIDDIWTGNTSHPATITLKNSVLLVEGDLDVRDLKGDNSTLYVNGNLFLNGGSLDAQDKGMLVMAENVIMEARGDFRGVIAARGVVTLRPVNDDERLLVRGAVISGGTALRLPLRNAAGVVMARVGPSPLIVDRSTVLHDTMYTKAFNRLGRTRMLMFRELIESR